MRSWILVRGLAREARHWGEFPDQLQASFPDDHVACVDLPGMGELKGLRSPLTVPGIVKQVRREVLRKQFKHTELCILTISLGGMVATDWASRYPGEIKKVVIMNSSSPLSPVYQRMRWQIWGEFLSGILKMDPKLREREILNLVANSPEKRAEFLPIWERVASEKSIHPLIFLSQLAAASRFQVPKNLASTKALFLVGLGDRLVEPQCTEELARHFASPLKRHPWGGHDLAIDDPEWVIARIQDWLAESKG